MFTNLKILRSVSKILFLAVLLQPGIFSSAHLAAGSNLPNASVNNFGDAVANQKKTNIILTSAVRRDQTGFTIQQTGECSADQVSSMQIISSAPDLQPAGFNIQNFQGSINYAQNSLEFNPNLNSGCFKIAIGTLQVQPYLAVQSAPAQLANLLGQPSQTQLAEHDAFTNGQIPEHAATIVFSGLNIFNQQKQRQNFNATIATAGARKYSLTKTSLNLAKLSVWRC